MTEFEDRTEVYEDAEGDVIIYEDEVVPPSRRGRAMLLAIIVILLLSLCGIAAVLFRMIQPSSDEVANRDEAGGLEWVRSIYGWGPAADELFVRPVKVDVASNGDIFVTDHQYRMVMRFSPTGNLVDRIGEDAEPDLYRVGTVAEGDGQLFFGQSSQDLVRVFTEAGESESMFRFPSPNDMEYENGRLAVSSNAGFVVFDREGQMLFEVGGTRGDGDDEFDVIPGLAYGPDGTLYVMDGYNNRISAYDEEGNRKWLVSTGKPSKGLDITNPAMAAAADTTAPAKLQLPSDAVVDNAGRLVVVDAMDFSISVFDTQDGSFIAKYGQYGTKDGQLMYPSSIDYDAERDWFVVADSGNRRVQIFRLPDSASGASAIVGAGRRLLSGPLRACLFPLLLIVLILVLWFVWRKLKQHRDAVAAADSVSGDDVDMEETPSLHGEV